MIMIFYKAKMNKLKNNDEEIILKINFDQN